MICHDEDYYKDNNYNKNEYARGSDGCWHLCKDLDADPAVQIIVIVFVLVTLGLLINYLAGGCH